MDNLDQTKKELMDEVKGLSLIHISAYCLTQISLYFTAMANGHLSFQLPIPLL